LKEHLPTRLAVYPTQFNFTLQLQARYLPRMRTYTTLSSALSASMKCFNIPGQATAVQLRTAAQLHRVSRPTLHLEPPEQQKAWCCKRTSATWATKGVVLQRNFSRLGNKKRGAAKELYLCSVCSLSAWHRFISELAHMPDS
jgi:hypothetical protein